VDNLPIQMDTNIRVRIYIWTRKFMLTGGGTQRTESARSRSGSADIKKSAYLCGRDATVWSTARTGLTNRDVVRTTNDSFLTLSYP